MCTATWLPLDGSTEPSSYALLFNRDESRLRGRATTPSVFRAEPGVPWLLAPRDADAGGTWIAANEHGLTVALLNRYRDAERIVPPADRTRSRGLLVLDLAIATEIGDVGDELRRQELDRYPAFTVLVAAPGARPTQIHWTGRDLIGPLPVDWPVSSSGLDARAASAARRELWREIRGDEAGTLEQALELHRSHRPERGALSPCMHRFVASTVSLTVVRVDAKQVSMAYADGPPCEIALGETVTLPLHQPSLATSAAGT